jgi:hypothetical protein
MQLFHSIQFWSMQTVYERLTESTRHSIPRTAIPRVVISLSDEYSAVEEKEGSSDGI